MTIIIILLVVIVNMIFILYKYGKNYKKELVLLFKEMATILNFEIEESAEIKKSTYTDNKLMLGSDLNFRHDINIQTKLIFKIFSYAVNKPLYRYYINFTYYTSKVISIIFALWIYTILFGVEIGVLGISLIVIVVLFSLQLFLQLIGFAFFDKQLKKSPLSSTFIQSHLKYLYFYIPMIMLNGILEFIYHIKWLFRMDK